MFSLNQSQNTLNQVKMTVTLPESNKKYTGNPRSEIIAVTPADAVYSIKNAQGGLIKMGRGNATLTGTELNMGVNSGANASYSIHPLGDENYTYVLDNQQSVTGTLSIGPSTITIESSGSTSFVYNGSTRTVGYTVAGVSNADPHYDVSVKSATNAGSYTAALSESSANYTLGSPSSFSWTITPSVITIASSGSTSFVYNGSTRTIGYTVAGVYAADTRYDVSVKSGINAGSYTAALSESSENYTLGSPSSFSWTITKAVLTLTTGNNSMTYGSSVPTQSFGYSLSGLLGADTTSVIAGSASHSTTATSSSNVGSYPITTSVSGLSATNYTFSAVNGTLTINPATLTASTINGSATYNGASQTVTVISGINGTYSGSTSVSQRDAGLYTTTITGTGNYTGNVIGTLTISPAPASSSGAYGTTIYSGYDGSQQSRVVIFNVSGLTYTGDTIVSLKKNVGTYPTSVELSGNYTGRLTGYLVITQQTGFISLFQIPTIQAGNTNTVVYNEHVDRVNTTSGVSYIFTTSAPYGPGAHDAEFSSYGVRSTSMATTGFKIDITATITDPNYTASSATTTITFAAYSAPPPSGGGTTTYY